MKTWIIRFSTYGIKNIEKKIQVDFYNNTISKGKKIDIIKKNVKGIFGINGAGKTAYILAIDIYNALTTKNDYLVQDVIKNKLDKLINKKTNELYMENIFAVSKENDDNVVDEVLKHTIIIKLSKNEYNQNKYILMEKMEKLTGTAINSSFSKIYEVINGQLITSDKWKDLKMVIEDYQNRLEQSTFSSYTLNTLLKLKNNNSSLDINQSLLLWYGYVAFYNSITTSVYVDAEDVHENIRINDAILNYSNNSFNLFNDLNKNYYISMRFNNNVISKKRFNNHINQVKKLKDFIQILKPNLLDIKVDYKIDGDNYHCRNIFVYDGYEVEEEYESTGIKRIIKMYNSINLAIKGYKVFIDELDANISGVFLDKMIEFIEENGKGQLCFSSHNILSMNILKRYSNSITTFGETGKVVNITKNGHYSPVNMFYEGFIEDSPFNINSFDFFKAF